MDRKRTLAYVTGRYFDGWWAQRSTDDTLRRTRGSGRLMYEG